MAETKKAVPAETTVSTGIEGAHSAASTEATSDRSAVRVKSKKWRAASIVLVVIIGVISLIYDIRQGVRESREREMVRTAEERATATTTMLVVQDQIRPGQTTAPVGSWSEWVYLAPGECFIPPRRGGAYQFQYGWDGVTSGPVESSQDYPQHWERIRFRATGSEPYIVVYTKRSAEAPECRRWPVR